MTNPRDAGGEQAREWDRQAKLAAQLEGERNAIFREVHEIAHKRANENARVAREANYREMRRLELTSQRALIDAALSKIEAAELLAQSKVFRS
jgi:hypothetical protein